MAWSFFFFLQSTVNLDIIKVFYLPTDAQENCIKNNIKIYLKQLLHVSVQSPSSGSALFQCYAHGNICNLCGWFGNPWSVVGGCDSGQLSPWLLLLLSANPSGLESFYPGSFLALWSSWVPGERVMWAELTVGRSRSGLILGESVSTLPVVRFQFRFIKYGLQITDFWLQFSGYCLFY
jgi:hypothetical protein